jgi:Predicted CoA-binding protein
MNEDQMLEKKIWAVVGANNDPAKYGNKIYKTLKAKGYEVYPVNPNYHFVEGAPCYPDLKSLPRKPEVINMVVAPRFGKHYVEEAAALGIKNLWLQPGTYDDGLLDLIAQKGLKAVQACILLSK